MTTTAPATSNRLGRQKRRGSGGGVGGVGGVGAPVVGRGGGRKLVDRSAPVPHPAHGTSGLLAVKVASAPDVIRTPTHIRAAPGVSIS